MTSEKDMRFQCGICHLCFDSKEECRRHIDDHKNDVIWQQVHLRREEGKWIFTVSEKRLGAFKNSFVCSKDVVHIYSLNKDWPVWWTAAKCTKESLAEARAKLKAAALKWYQKRAQEIEALEVK